LQYQHDMILLSNVTVIAIYAF